MSRSPLKQGLIQVAGVALLVASAYYMFGVLRNNFDELRHGRFALTAVQWSWLTIGALGTLVCSTLYHVLATRRIQPGSKRGARIGLAYSLGQIVRYVPGKVVGVLFQTRYIADLLRASTVAMALVVQMLYDYVWSFLFAAAVLLCAWTGYAWPLLLLAPVGMAIWWSHHAGLFERALVVVGPVRRLFDPAQLSGFRRPPHAAAATTLLLMEWLPLMAGIGLALGATLGWPGAMVVGALYLLASIGSLLIFVVPSGLVVREAMFVWLGLRFGFDAPMLVLLGLALRVSLTIAEVLNVTVFFAADQFARSKESLTTAR